MYISYISFFLTGTLAELFYTCQMLRSACTAEPLLLAWEECLKNLVPNEARSQVCTAHYAGVAGRILHWRFCGHHQAHTVFVGVLITPLLVTQAKSTKSLFLFSWLNGLQGMNCSSASMTGSNPVTLTGLWAAVLLNYEVICGKSWNESV